MSTSDITHQDACSSPDQLLDDAMNSNERLEIRECSDDDHLERLGRRVSEFITANHLTKQSTLTAITASHTTQSTSTQHSENGNESVSNCDLIYITPLRRSATL